MAEQQVIEEVVVTAKRINRTIPPLECPNVLLPTPANLTNYFGALITEAEKGITSEIDEISEEAKKLKKILDEIRDKILGPYDPKFEKLEIPEKEYEIMIRRMIGEYSTYVQAKIMEIIKDVTSISITVNILGVEIDVIKFATDRDYLQSIKDQIDVDSMYDLLPPEYQLMIDKFESREYKLNQIDDFIRMKVKEYMNNQINIALDALDALGFKIPTNPAEAIEELILKIIEDTEKSIEEKIDEIMAIKVGPFTLEEILGGEFNDDVEIPEFTLARLVTKIKEFAQDYFSFLIKEAIQAVKDALDAVGLGKLVEFLTLDFCDFLEIIGFPKKIDLSGFEGIKEEPNTFQSSLSDQTIGQSV